MKTKFIFMYLVINLILTETLLAAEMPEAAKKNRCTACHAIDKALVGPAWMEVSKFYNGKIEKTTMGKTLKEVTENKTPAEWLLIKISKGGNGNWGRDIMMPSDPTGKKQDDLKLLVDFVLGLAKK
jgi:cytochrome c